MTVDFILAMPLDLVLAVVKNLWRLKSFFDTFTFTNQ